MPAIVYAVVMCFSNPGCQAAPAAGEPAFRSVEDCLRAMIHDYSYGHMIGNRLYLDMTNDMWVECLEKTGSSEWKHLPARPCAPGQSQYCP